MGSDIKTLVTQLAAQLATVGAIVDVEDNELVIKIPIVEQLKATLRGMSHQLAITHGLTMNVTDVSMIDQSRIRVVLELDVTPLLLNVKSRIGMFSNVTFENGEVRIRIRLPRNVNLK